MIVLDTNVVSELMAIAPTQAVVEWAVRQTPDDLFVTTITLLELRYGIELLPVGRRRDDADRRLTRALSAFGPGYIQFGELAAEHCARLLAIDRNADLFDVQIAAIALAHGASVATRNTKHFAAFGIELIDPWTA